MAYIQNSIAYRTVYLTLADIPATAIAYNAFVLEYKKSGQAGWSVKTMTALDWTNLGDGMYSVRFSAADMNTLGDFTFKLTGVGFDNFVYDEFTVEQGGSGGGGGGPSFALPEQCIVSGSVAAVSMIPGRMTKVVARPAAYPVQNNGTLLTGDAVWTFVDAFGNFTLPLIRRSTVIIEIERTGIKAQIVIPDAPSANLVDLLPPIPDYSL